MCIESKKSDCSEILCPPCRILVLVYNDSFKKQQSGGHKMDANNIYSNECIHFASKPLQRNT